VTLVSDNPETLRRALESIPTIELSVVSPEDALDGPTADVTVLDATLPEALPPGPLLIVNPPQDNAILPVNNVTGAVVPTKLDPQHSLLQGVDPNALQLEQGLVVAPPVWARTVVASSAGPLILDGRRSGQPVVVFAFDPAGSGLAKSIAFPLLVGNAIMYLESSTLGPSSAPGVVVTLPGPENGRAVLVRPDGSRQALRATDGTFDIVETDVVGRYTLLDASGRAILSEFTVNLLNMAESDIRPRRDLAPLPAAVPDEQTAGEEPAAGDDEPRDEWWRLLVVAGLVVLGIEWLAFARRG
jgi:hypothetical protein